MPKNALNSEMPFKKKKSKDNANASEMKNGEVNESFAMNLDASTIQQQGKKVGNLNHLKEILLPN